MPNEIPKQVRLNALLAYCLLGPLFLFAKSNPQLNHEYIRIHAKKSSIILLLTITSFLISGLIFRPFLASIFIPVINISLIHALNIVIALISISLLAKGMYESLGGEGNIHYPLQGEEQGNIIPQKDDRILTGEQEKISTLLSYIPFVSAALFEQSSDRELIRSGYIVSSASFTIFFIFFLHDPLSMPSIACGFATLSILSYLSINALFRGSQSLTSEISLIPTRTDIELCLRVLPLYLSQYFGRKNNQTPLEFGHCAAKIYQEDLEREEIYKRDYPHIRSGKYIFFLHIPLVSLFSTIIAYKKSLTLYRSLFASNLVGVICLISLFTNFTTLTAISISYLVIIAIRTSFNNSLVSSLFEEIRLMCSRAFHHTHSQGKEITEKITNREEKIY